MRRTVSLAVLTVMLFGWNAGLSAADEEKKAEPSEAHKKAVAKITEAGGAVRRIAQNTDENEVSLSLAPPPIEDKILSAVADVDNVVWLELQGTAITDDGLKELAGLKKLRRLHIERTAITDKGLKHLSGLSELEYLNLYGTKVTDKGLDQLKSLKKLRKLYVWGTKVSDEGMVALGKAMPELAVVGAAKPLVIPPTEEELKKEAEKKIADAQSKKIKAPGKALATGVAVRIKLPSKNFLSLAEVEVYPVGKDAKLKGKAEQSSTFSEGSADKAIDGNRDGIFSNSSVTHTGNGGDEWWTVKFDKANEIGSIHIWNRADCCGDRLSGAVVEILDDKDKVVWSESVKEAANGGSYDFVGK